MHDHPAERTPAQDMAMRLLRPFERKGAIEDNTQLTARHAFQDGREGGAAGFAAGTIQFAGTGTMEAMRHPDGVRTAVS
jgi:hypothetical protein